MSTARDLIKDSMLLIGAIASSETPTADEQADGLRFLIRMLASWSTEGLAVHTRVREEFTLTPSDGSYTMGASGDFNTTRPIQIEIATIEDQSVSPTTEWPIEIITLAQWAAIVTKDLTAVYPTRLYADAGNPLTNIYLWPVPTVANKLVLYSWKPFSAIASANTTVDLPPGYEEAIVYNLSIRLAPQYGKVAAAEVIQVAADAKESIKRLNVKPAFLAADDSTNGTVFNIYTGV